MSENSFLDSLSDKSVPIEMGSVLVSQDRVNLERGSLKPRNQSRTGQKLPLKQGKGALKKLGSKSTNKTTRFETNPNRKMSTDKPINRQKAVGFPSYIPYFKEHPNIIATEVERERREKIKIFIKKAITLDPITNKVTGVTLFSDLIDAKTPKWKWLS
jgi:hypothetical protein